MKRRSSAPALLLVAGLFGGTAEDVVGQLRGPEVTRVTFQGNETFPSDSLEGAVVTQETECRSFVLQLIPFCGLGFDFALLRGRLREQELPRDRARVAVWYINRGFWDVQVDSPTVLATPEGVEVVFSLVEGEPVRVESIAYEGLEEIDAPDLLRDLPLREGELLNDLALGATRDTIISRLRNQGYARADVLLRRFRPADDLLRAQVTFEVVPGPPTRFGEIRVSDNDNLSLGTILRTIQFADGDLYRDVDIEQARQRLFGLDIVRSATVQPDLLAGQDSVVPVDVVVQEGDAYRVRTGAGWTTSECLNLEARWASRNFVGGGRLLQVRGRMGNLLAPQVREPFCPQAGVGSFARLTWLGAVDFQQPWAFSTNNTLSGSVFLERQTLPDIFIRRAIGFQIALTRLVDSRTSLSLFYRPEVSELDADDVLYCSGFLVCTPSDIRLLEGANWLAPVGLTVTRDLSDNVLNPRSGYRLAGEVEHAGPWTGSNFRYDRLIGEIAAYSEITPSSVFATRLRGGWVGSATFDLLSTGGTALVHPQRRFFAGGANSVRGFPQSRLGPRVLIPQRPEQLLSSTGAGCSVAEIGDQSCDAGVGEVEFVELPTGGTRVVELNAELRFTLARWLEAVTFADYGQAFSPQERMSLGRMEFTPGVGIRFPSPVGPIRVDLAYRGEGFDPISVVTPLLDPYDPLIHDPDDRLNVDGSPIPFVTASQLTILNTPVLFERPGGRFQLHISIGQAF